MVGDGSFPAILEPRFRRGHPAAYFTILPGSFSVNQVAFSIPAEQLMGRENSNFAARLWFAARRIAAGARFTNRGCDDRRTCQQLSDLILKGLQVLIVRLRAEFVQ